MRHCLEGIRFMLRMLLASAAVCLLTLPAAAQRPPILVFFPEWSAQFDDTAQAIVDSAASLAKQSPDSKITVTGYADPKGSPQADIYLSQVRAQRVIDRLLADGVDVSRITMDAAGRQLTPGVASRRVEIVLTP
jgi:outer membrane protein OmpA-like peptidoglycan-associated protein